MKKVLKIGLTAFLALAGIASAANYGVFVGLNTYNTSYIGSDSFLDGCVPDAMHMYTNATQRGSWTAGNSQVLTNALGTRVRIRQAISNYAATAVSGDTFLYFHSSHGGNDDWPYSTSVYLCAYDADYSDTLLAQDLAKFATGVKVVVVVDACHSGGLFQSRGVPTLAAATPAPWNLAARVTELMEADRAAKIARGVKGVDKLISASEIGWVTAANYDQYSWDDTDGGAFTTAAIAGWTNGTCDNATYGDQNGYANFYELWNYAKDIAIGYPGETDPYDGTSYETDAQAYNTNVLKSAIAGIAGDGPVADQPPTIALNPAGTNKTVTFANPLSFTVTATDGDGLAVALSASGLPAGATAPTTNGTGAVATIFNWTPAEAQVGVHQFSFSATDDDGTTTVGVKVTVTDGSTTADLFISEYVEGSSSEKYIEIFNGTGADVDLSNYRLQLFNNGTNVANPSVTLSGTLANGAVKVYRNTSASNYSGEANTAVNFNGDDAVALYKISSAAYVDIVGRIGEDPGTAWTSGSLSTLNQTLVRKSTVASGVTENPASGFPTLATEWDTYAQDTVAYLGSHVFGGGGATTSAPAFNALGGQSATVGQAGSFTVSATGNPAPTLALQGTTASGGYTFTAGTGLLAYTPPEADLGDRTFTFTASNVAGVATQTVSVTVSAAPVLVPTASIANLASTSFTVNWTAITGGTTYQVQVATDTLFVARASAKDVLLSEDFATLVDAAVPAGWTTSGASDLDYVSSPYFGLAVPSYKFKTTGQWLASPAFAAGATNLQFWAFGNGSGTASTIAVSGLVSSVWTLIDTVAIAISGATYQVAMPAQTTQLKFSFTKNGYNCALDDVVVSGTAGPVGGSSIVIDQTVAALTYGATGLEPETTYHVRVRGTGGTWSGVVSATTPAEGGGTTPAPEPIVIGHGPGGGASSMSLQIPSTLGVTYQLQYTTNLLGQPPVWLPAATTNGTGAEVTLDDANPIDGQRYYRIVKP